MFRVFGAYRHPDGQPWSRHFPNNRPIAVETTVYTHQSTICRGV